MRAFNQCWVLRGCGSAFCWDFRAVEPEKNVVAFQREQVFCILLPCGLYLTTQEILILPESLFHRISWVGKALPDSKIRLKNHSKSD